MKKSLLMMLLAVTLMVSGCGSKQPQETQPVETETVEESDILETTEEETVETEQEETAGYDISGVDEYLASVKEQSLAIKDYLENEAMTQTDMNVKSQELYELWDETLNYLWGELKTNLPENDFSQLLEEQRTWIAEKETAVEAAGKDYEGGSMYALAVNSEAADLTEARVYELYEILNQIK